MEYTDDEITTNLKSTTPAYNLKGLGQAVANISAYLTRHRVAITVVSVLTAMGIFFSGAASLYETIFEQHRFSVEAHARKECAEWTLNKVSNNQTTGYDQKAYDDYYIRCLNEHGI